MRFWHDLHRASSCARVVRVDEDEETDVHLKPGTFVLRITFDEHRLPIRCSIRHVGSGQTAYVQGGPELAQFIKDYLIEQTDAQ